MRRFFLSLDAYIDSPNPVIPYKDILYGAADKDYATILKRIKRKSFLISWNAEQFEIPDWWDNVPSYLIKDIGDIFNYSYLPFFNEEVDDYLHGFEPVHIHKDSISVFKKFLRSILPPRSSFNKIEEFDVLSKISSSISLEEGTNKHLPHYLLKNKNLSFSEERSICSRSIIPVSPANIRDSVLNNPRDLNTISYLDLQIMEILKHMPGHIHLRDKDRVTRRLRRLYKKSYLFLQRDIRKEGITKPRELLKAILEVLHDEYPDIRIFGFTSFYDNFSLLVNEEILYPPRGHGLGMANTMTTLMQLVVHEWIVNELINDIPEFESHCLCLNDDFVVGFNDEYHLESYWDMEDEIMEKLSIIRAPEKSFRSRDRFVLAERYFTPTGEDKKVSYQLRELLLPLACANITHAKEYFLAAQNYVASDLVPFYMNEIQSYWGYEFFPTEFNYPSFCGGWINEKINSVNMGLVLLDSLDFKSYVCRGFKASIYRHHKPAKGNYYNSPLRILYNDPYIPKEFYESYDILTMNQLHDKFGRILSKSGKEFTKFYSRLYKRRQEIFKKDFSISYYDFCKLVINQFPTVQFYPNETMIDCYHIGNSFRRKITDPYLDSNPLVAALGVWNSLAYPFKETFSLRFSKEDASTKKSEGLFSKDVQKTLKSEHISSLATGLDDYIYYPSDGYNPEEQYLNSIKIGEVTSILNWGFGYPSLKKDFEHPLIEEKRSVYGRIFSFQELSKISELQVSRTVLKIVCEYLERHPEENLIDTLNYLLEQINLEDNIHEDSPKQEEEDESDDEYPFINLMRHTQDDRETIVVGYDDFVVNPALFWNWRCNRFNSDYVFSPKTQQILEQLNIFVMLVSDERFFNKESLQDEIDNLMSDMYGHEILLLASRSGVLKFMTDKLDDDGDTHSLNQDAGSLFDDADY